MPTYYHLNLDTLAQFFITCEYLGGVLSCFATAVPFLPFPTISYSSPSSSL